MFRAGAVGTVATVGTVPGGARAGASATRPAGDLVLFNGKIHTMAGRVVEVLAIHNGRIVHAGNELAVARRGVPGHAKLVNLHGRTAIPGIIDNHNHLVLMGNRPGHHTPLENAYSIADVARTYRDRARRVPAGEFITTIGGFHFNQFREVRLPTLSELDSAVPNHPAYLSVSFNGPSVTNSPGKAFFKAAQLPAVVGPDGSIAAGTETGKATLALRRTLTFEQRKRGRERSLRSEPSTLPRRRGTRRRGWPAPSLRGAGLRDAMAYAASVGVTTHLDQGAFQATGTPSDGAAHEDNFAMHQPFLAVYAEGAGIVRLRINFLHMETDPALPELTQRLHNAYPFFGDDLVRTGGIGEFLASGLGPTWLDAARKVAAAGWRAEVHSLTPTDFQTEIQGFETVNAEHSITGLRWVVAHVPFITRDHVDRLNAIGGGVNLTGWRYLAGTPAQNGPPFRMIVDSGIHAGMSSDGMQIAPMNPFIHAYYATTGRNALGQLINDGQQISRPELLTLYTSANGWFLGGPDEHRLGTLEEGRLGDVAVLDRDYFTVPDEALRSIRPVLTVVGGTIVHNTGEVT